MKKTKVVVPKPGTRPPPRTAPKDKKTTGKRMNTVIRP